MKTRCRTHAAAEQSFRLSLFVVKAVSYLATVIVMEELPAE
jgi:hypothetical protein